MKKRFFAVIFIFIIVLLLAACGEKTYNVSGRIIDTDGNGVPNVIISFSGGISGTTVSGSDGSWSMSGLKGTVVIRPVKAGWVFEPREKTVTAESNNLIFTGDNGNDALIMEMMWNYCQAFNEENVQELLNYYHSSYFTNNNITSEELSKNLADRFENENLKVTIKDTQSLNILDTTADLILLIGTELNGVQSVDYIWEVSLAQENENWYITQMAEWVYEVYVERPYIEEVVNNFLEAFKSEDIMQIDSLTSENYSDFEHSTKANFIVYIEELFTRLDIYSYESTIDSINSFEVGNVFAKISLTADMSTDGVRTDRTLHFDFTLIKEGDFWLVYSLKIDGDTIKVYEIDIEEADGKTDYIEFTVAMMGKYDIRTEFYLSECDTVLALYDADKNEITQNDDGIKPYSVIVRDLTPGTYYIKVWVYNVDLEPKPLNCHLEISRVGL